MDVYLSKNALREFQKLTVSAQKKVKKKLTGLREAPYEGKALSGELKGLYSIRAWPYRILYEINEKKRRIEIHKIAHRQGAYR